MVDQQHLTPSQVARAIGVSEASLKRWCDKGLLRSIRTAGGHRRIELSGVIQYLRETGQPLVRPELLGLTPVSGQGHVTIDRCAARILDALTRGDEEQARRVVLDLYLARHSALEICDKVLAKAFHEIGDRWSCGKVEIYQERRGCEICLRLLHELRRMLAPLRPDAPRAIGGSMEGDHYLLPNAMIELVLREQGWMAETLGSNLTASTLVAAVESISPQLMWISVSHISSDADFLQSFSQISSKASQLRIPLAVGGRALTKELREHMQYSAYCDNFTHLSNFASTIRPAPAPQAEPK